MVDPHDRRSVILTRGIYFLDVQHTSGSALVDEDRAGSVGGAFQRDLHSDSSDPSVDCEVVRGQVSGMVFYLIDT